MIIIKINIEKINSYIDQYSNLRQLLKDEKQQHNNNDRESDRFHQASQENIEKPSETYRINSIEKGAARSALSSEKKHMSHHKNEDDKTSQNPYRTKVYRQGMPRPATANSANRPNISIPSVRPKNFFFRDNEKIFYEIETELDGLQIAGR